MRSIGKKTTTKQQEQKKTTTVANAKNNRWSQSVVPFSSLLLFYTFATRLKLLSSVINTCYLFPLSSLADECFIVLRSRSLGDQYAHLSTTVSI